MRILIISNLYPPHCLGGYEILCDQVRCELQRQGHEVAVLTSTHGLTDDKAPTSDRDVHPVLDLYLPFCEAPRLLRHRRWWVGLRNYRITRKFIARWRPDVIFIWSQLRLTVGPARAAEASGFPVAYTFNDEHPAGFVPARFGATLRKLYRYIGDHLLFPGITLQGLRLKHVTCISRILKQNLLASGVAIEHAKVNYQGIPLERFPLKDKPGSIHPQAKVLYVGQLHPYKGVHTLVEAANLVARHVGAGAVKVSIVGTGDADYERSLRDMVAEGDADIEFLGKRHHAELGRIYREHDIFVFPSIWQEPFGLTHLEAMASGTCVISTAEGGQAEFLIDGENSLLFKAGDARELAVQIAMIMGNNHSGKHLAVAARRMVEERFCLRRYTHELETFLTQTVELHP